MDTHTQTHTHRLTHPSITHLYRADAWGVGGGGEAESSITIIIHHFSSLWKRTMLASVSPGMLSEEAEQADPRQPENISNM